MVVQTLLLLLQYEFSGDVVVFFFALLVVYEERHNVQRTFSRKYWYLDLSEIYHGWYDTRAIVPCPSQ